MLSNEELEEINVVNVTVSCLPEPEIESLENYLCEISEEIEFDHDHMRTFQALILGYYSAWDAVDELKKEVERQSELANAYHQMANKYLYKHEELGEEVDRIIKEMEFQVKRNDEFRENEKKLLERSERYRTALQYYATKQHFKNYEDGVTARQALDTSHA